MKRIPLFVVVSVMALATASATTITFSTFVSNSSLGGAMGDTSVIGYTYAGNKFVGSFYPGDPRLYSTNLSGGAVTFFGSVPGASGEVVVGASLGRGGFATGNIFAGSGANGQIYQFGNGGGAASLFTTLPGGAGVVRGIMFDPGSSFGGDMIVSTTSGQIFRVSSSGVATLLVNFGADTEGMDIVGSSFGKYAGDLLTASEGSCLMHLVSPTGTVTTVGCVGGGAETVAFVPMDLGSGDPTLEGFYAADYPVDIVKADPTQFTQGFTQLGGANLLGDAIVTSESSHAITDIHYNGDILGTFTLTGVGSYPNQPEDGIFVTAERIGDVGAVPEPSSWILMASGLASVASVVRRRLRR